MERFLLLKIDAMIHPLLSDTFTVVNERKVQVLQSYSD